MYWSPLQDKRDTQFRREIVLIMEGFSVNFIDAGQHIDKRFYFEF